MEKYEEGRIMIKKSIYPKTERVKVNGNSTCEVTEKLDGANLCIFKKNGLLHFAQRNNIYTTEELEEAKGIMYKGLYAWIEEHKQNLEEELREGSCLCGEWLGMGTLKYDVGEFDKRFYMFAKANINDNYELYNMIYYHEFFKYPFNSLVLPPYIGEVPIAYTLGIVPDKEKLDELYMKYVLSHHSRNVEGFVVNYMNKITKYVRMKNGKLQEHVDRGE